MGRRYGEMFMKIQSIEALDDMTLVAVFLDGTEKKYNIRQLYQELPQLKALEEDLTLFKSVRVSPGGYAIEWNDELDLAAEEIWYSGEDTGKRYEVDLEHSVAAELAKAREAVGMTQRDLAQAANVSQYDINKIESAKANPSLNTLKRLAKGMGMQLHLVFMPVKENSNKHKI